MRIHPINMTDQGLIEAELALKWSVRLGIVSDQAAAFTMAVLGAEKGRRMRERERAYTPDPVILGFTAGMLILDDAEKE